MVTRRPLGTACCTNATRYLSDKSSFATFTPNWLKNEFETALSRDPVDPANDEEVLAQVLDARALGGSQQL